MRRAALVVAMVASALLVFGTARPAHACSCAVQDDATSFANADAVFVGRAVDEQVAPGDEFRSNDPKRVIFEVDDVYRGDVFARQSIVTPRESATCGLSAGGTGRWLVFATRSGGLVGGAVPGEFYAYLCGVREVTTDEALPASIATRAPPKDGASPVGTFTAARTAVTTTADAPAGPLDTTTAPVSSTWNWVAFVVAVLLAVAAVIAIRRRARTIAS